MAALTDYPHVLDIPTRWKDNDVYGHVNNVEYYSYFDTVINRWLVTEGGLDIHDGAVIGLCVESHCAFKAALAFPDTVRAGLRVAHLGRTSVRYEIGLFREDDAEPAAEGWFVHVFVDRGDRRPREIPARVRAALERLVGQLTSSSRRRPRSSTSVRSGRCTSRASTASQPGQRSVRPGARTNMRASASGPDWPQPSQTPTICVTSTANSSCRSPAAALPSSIVSSIVILLSRRSARS